MSELTGYSIKAKKKIVLAEPIVYSEMKNGTIMFKGKDPEHGTTVCSIKGKDDAMAIIEAKGYQKEVK